MASSSAWIFGKVFFSADRGSVLRMPATTSSPWALIRKSPYSPFAPVAGSRVNPTPVPERSSRLPNTMAWTLTAVPRSWAMPSCSR